MSLTTPLSARHSSRENNTNNENDSVDREMEELHRRLPNSPQQHSLWRHESIAPRGRTAPASVDATALPQVTKRVSQVASSTRALPPSHVEAHLAFYSLCQQPLDPTARDWNAQFQDYWSRHSNRESQSVERREQLREFLLEYEAYCLELAKSLVAERAAELTGLSEDVCVRIGNVVVQVWRDVKLAQNMQRCFCVAMECRPPNLHFPLSATFRYLHVAVSFRALVPLRADKIPEYVGDGSPDAVINVPLCEYIHVLRCATNVKLAASANRTDKVVGVEVYEALDAALYVFNCVGILPPITASTASTRTPTLRRWRHMSRHEARSWSEQPALKDYAMSGHEVYAMLSPLLQDPAKHRLARLVEILHANGLNVCLLGSLLQWLMQTPKDEQEADVDGLARLMAVEILARAIRSSVCAQMSRDASPGTLAVANSYLMRAMASVVDNPVRRFRDGLRGCVEMKFIFDPLFALEAVMEYLEVTLQEFPSSVTQRLCQLMGISVARGSITQIDCKPSKHNFSELFSSQWDSVRAELSQNAEGTSPFAPEFYYAYLLPLQEEQYYRSGRLQSAWDCARRQVEYWRSDPQAGFTTAHVCGNSALCAAMCGRPNAAEYLANAAIQTLEHTFMYYSESMLPSGAAHMKGGAAASAACATPTQAAAPSRYGIFVYGLVHARLTQGYVRCYAKQYFDAAESFDAALHTPDILGQWRLPFMAQLRLEAVLGLFEVATRGSAEYIDCFARVWEATCETLHPTALGAHVHELLGSLYMERGLFQLAAAEFWDCIELREAMAGEDSLEVAQTLNKLGLLYYNSDVARCGLHASCILHRAEAIVVNAQGLYSAQHMAICENIIALFIRRGQYVEASQRLYTLQHLPPRYAKRLPRDHPTIIRLSELETKLRSVFTPWAVQIVQRSWRQYRARQLVGKVLESSARILQCAGRGLVIRRALALVSQNLSTMETIYTREMMTSMHTASDELVRMSTCLSRQIRNWNMEYQACRFLCDWNTPDDISASVKQIDAIRLEFTERATELAQQREQRLIEKAARDGGLGNGAAPFVKDNILLQPVLKNDRLVLLQNLVYQHFSRTLFSPLTAPLSAIVHAKQHEYFAIALPPLHRDPQYLLFSDGRAGPTTNDISNSMLSEVIASYHDAGLSSMSENYIRGVECIRGQDGLFYITNGLGLVNKLLFSRDLCSDGALGERAAPLSDPGVTARQERGEWVAAPSLERRVLNLIVAGKAEEAVSAIEGYAMSRVIRTRAQKLYYSCLIDVVRAGRTTDVTSLEAVAARATNGMEDSGAFFLATVLGLTVARVLCAHDAFKAALPFLIRNVYLLRRKLRLHAYFSSYLILDTAALLLTASNGCKKAVDSATLEAFIPTLELSEPSCLFFTVLERMIQYCQMNGRRNLAEDFQTLRAVRAKQLPLSLRQHLVATLMRRGDDCVARGAPQECVHYLTASIHLCSLNGGHDALSVELGVLYTRYGAVLTTLNNLVAARKSLSKAYSILTKASSSNSPEMLTLHKHHRILKARLRDNAILLVRRAVRRWREQRRLDVRTAREQPEQYWKMQNVRVLRRMKRLVVSEATSRVLVLEAQTEAWYLLLRKQLRMRNEAMLRQTYGTRVQIYVDKLESVRADLVELAIASKVTIAEYGLAMHARMLFTMLETTHRLERRVIIRDWTVSCVQLKQWHLEHSDEAIREEFLRAYQRYLLRCVSAEEGIWRRMIAQNQLKTKKMIGRYIVKRLRQRRRNPCDEIEALKQEETRLRDKIATEETNAYKEIVGVFIFGPIVHLDDDDDW